MDIIGYNNPPKNHQFFGGLFLGNLCYTKGDRSSGAKMMIHFMSQIRVKDIINYFLVDGLPFSV